MMWKSLLLLLFGAVLLGGMPVRAEEVKTGKTCGCAVDAYSVYGAGQDSCAVFLSEQAANPDSNQTDGSYGQTLGWIAGYMSAVNRAAAVRDAYDMDLDYVAAKLATWCQQHPDEILSEAMDVLTDSRSGTSELFQ